MNTKKVIIIIVIAVAIIAALTFRLTMEETVQNDPETTNISYPETSIAAGENKEVE